MKLWTIWLALQLTAALFWYSCYADLARNVQYSKDHPMRLCGGNLLNGNPHECVGAFVNSFKANEGWSKAKGSRICETSCIYNQKGRFLGWEWVWDTRIRCNSNAPGYIGEATKKSRSGSLHWATKDLYTKAKSTIHLTADERECWEKLI
ncbi:unnamed protein product [Adineta ricciae]|uniref:Uncharacterized protein n=2 Tax=Adineta ricciae TaxID=249248 RepID=A0A814RZG9_ADIRI|nr:unnamed protein product [Adineta ricciae]